MRQFLSVAIISFLVCAVSSALADVQGRWVATSTASIAITGDIALNGDVLTFANGTKLPLVKVSQHNGRLSPVGGNKPGAIYQLSPPSDPALLNGNTLCGMKYPVTYIVLSKPYGGGLALSVFTSAEPPQAFGDHNCAAYFYER